jgi:Na+/serine symporter
MKRWLLWCSTLGLVIPLLILLMYPPNTDAALNALITRLLWPSRLILMAAPAHTPPSGVAFVIGISVMANILVYLGIGLLVWTAASWTRRLRHNRSR